MVYNNDDEALNKIPLKSVSDDDEKNAGEFTEDVVTVEEARQEAKRAKFLLWLKRLTIALICFIGIALIIYLIITLCFNDESNKQIPTTVTVNSFNINDNNLNIRNKFNDTEGLHATITTTKSVSLEILSTLKDYTVNVINISSSTLRPIQINNISNTTYSSSIHDTLQDIPINVDKFHSILSVYKNAAVCSDRYVCSQIGSNIMQEGGSAVDGAIATLLCNGITIMHSMGIGGGVLMNVYIKERQQAFSIDAREVAPYAATQDMFDNKNPSEYGALAIAVPGELKGYHRAHEKFGILPWKKLVEPSIKLCHDGFYMTKHIQQAVLLKESLLKKNEIFRKMFFNASIGVIYPLGTKLHPIKELCNTYKLLAENGPIDFYNGSLSKLVIKDLEEIGSIITSDDLESYRADMVNSITMRLDNNILHAVPPISSGTIVANILSILEGFNFTKADISNVQYKANVIHLMTEAMKFSFAKRWELGDVRFNDVRELVSRLTNPETGNQMRALINKTSVLNNIHKYGIQYSNEDDMGTSHLSLLSPNGDAVSATSSINDYFGSMYVGRRTGIIFNGGMFDFSIPGRKDIFNLPSSPINFIDAQKRPMSSMSPMILTDADGNVRIVIGAAGGSKIISSIVEVIAGVLWFDQNIKEAIDAPRFHHQLVPNILEYEENSFSSELLKLLEAKGHKTQSHSRVGSVVCGIVRNETAIYTNADYRKEGGTAGF